MTDFETDLRVRLQRLDAAVPPSSSPSVDIAARRSLGRRRGILTLGLAAMVTLVLGTAVVIATTPPPSAVDIARDTADEERVNADLAVQLGYSCLDQKQAEALVRERLDILGLATWTIRVAGNEAAVRDAPCVEADAIGASHEVLLSPSMGMTVARAMDELALSLMTTCANWEEAAAQLRSSLRQAGIPNPRIVSGGVRGVPGPPDGDEAKAYLQHIADGCVVYGGTGSDNTGNYTWYLTGR